MKKNTLLAIAITLNATTATHAGGLASNNLVDAQIGYGLQSLLYSAQGHDARLNTTDLGEPEKKWGVCASLTLTHYLSRHWGLLTGAMLQQLRTDLHLNGTDEYAAYDAENKLDCIRTTTYSNWTEKQKTLLLSIPLGPTYRTPLSNKTDLHASCGVELQLPLSNSFEVENGTIEAKGYYPAYNATLEQMPEHRFGTYNDRPTGKADLKTGLGLFAEMGVRFLVGNMTMNTAAYFSYTPSNLCKGTTKPLFDQNNHYNSALNANTTNEAHSMAAGVKLGFTFPLGKKE